MAQVKLNVYDVTNSESEGTNRAVAALNSVGHAIGFGGMFHGAVEVYGEEWSFGFCPQGTGVYNCQPQKNPFYTYRQTIDLGITTRSKVEVAALLSKLRREWPGNSYNLLNRNCCNFCEVFCRELGSRPVPGWLNRVAAGAETALVFTDRVVESVLSWSNQISSGSQCAISWIRSPFRTWTNPIVGTTEQQLEAEQEGGRNHPDVAPFLNHSLTVPGPGCSH